MAKGYYKCECGKEFDNPQKFNGHKSHCNIHLIAASKLEERKRQSAETYARSRKTYYSNMQKRKDLREQEKQAELELWISERHRCEKCGKVMPSKYGSGRFCSKKCSHSREQTAEINKKRSYTAKETSKKQKEKRSQKRQQCFEKKLAQYALHPACCEICGKTLPYMRRNRKTCSIECKKEALSRAGRKAAQLNTATKRSVHEIEFYDICKNYFKSVKHNAPIFNGWDADIIIEDYKLAILWNGPWHYKKVFKQQKISLKQIQNRDRIKYKEIKKAGYICYIIKDMTLASNKMIVKSEFEQLLQYIEKNKLHVYN